MAGNKRSSNSNSKSVASSKPAAKAAPAPLAAKSTKSSSAPIQAQTSMATATGSKTTTAAATSVATASKKPAVKGKMMITSEERHRMIAEAAYFIAEKRGFQEGSSEQDWLEATAQIDRKIMASN